MRRPAKFRTPEHPALGYRPPAHLRAAKWAAIIAAGLALLSALYVGLWFYAAGRVRDAALAWIEARRQEGATVSFAHLDIGGFPFELHLSVSKPALAFPKTAAPWSWQGDAVTATLRPWNFGRLVLRAPGSHAVTWTANGATRAVHGSVASLLATLHLAGGRLTAVEAELGAATFDGDAPLTHLSIGRGTLTADFPPAPEATDRTPIADVQLAFKDLGAPPAWGLPLGPAVASLELNASMLGSLPPGPPATALAQWRDDGGTVDIRRLGLAYGPLTLTADGTLALDAAMQPIGAFTARAEGFLETIDALRTHGIIRSRDAVTAKLVLGALSKRGDDGRTTLTAPLTIQDRRLYAGPVPLLDIPAVPWGGAKTGG